jgi:ATP-dependent RNA helicase DDX46/PRP5
MAAFKRQEIMQRGKEKVILGMEEDEDDKFLLTLQDPDEEGYVDAQKRREQKKDLKKVDHAQQNYIPINKNLYIETKEISRMTEKEVSEFRKVYGDIKVRGLKCPKPISNWYQCGLPDKVMEVIEKKNFIKPFPIQCQSISPIMSGRDVIGIAETGSGKTLAYILPLIRHIRD